MKYNYISIKIIVATCFLANFLSAQNDRLFDIYNKEVISYGGKTFIKDGQRLKFKEVEPLLLKFPDSSTEFASFRKKVTMSQILMIPGILLMGLTLSEARENDTAYLYALGGGGFIISGLIIGNQSNRHLQNSVWFYNRNILLKMY